MQSCHEKSKPFSRLRSLSLFVQNFITSRDLNQLESLSTKENVSTLSIKKFVLVIQGEKERSSDFP